MWPLMGLLTGHRIKEGLLGASLVGRGCWLCSTSGGTVAGLRDYLWSGEGAVFFSGWDSATDWSL